MLNILLAVILLIATAIWGICELASGFSKIAFAYAMIFPLLFFGSIILGSLIEMNWQWQKMMALYPNAPSIIFIGLLVSWVIPIFSRLESKPEKK